MTAEEVMSVLRGTLEKRGDVRFAALFGSTATRGPDQARDLDVALSFNHPMPWLELGALIAELEHVSNQKVDLVDLDDASTLVRWEVLRTGRLIVAADIEAWRRFQTRVPMEWDDLRPYFERESEGLRKVLEGKKWSGSIS